MYRTGKFSERPLCGRNLCDTGVGKYLEGLSEAHFLLVFVNPYLVIGSEP